MITQDKITDIFCTLDEFSKNFDAEVTKGKLAYSMGETTEQQNAVGTWLCDYAESRQPFDKIKHRHTLKEVGDVAEGKYDWKIENIQQRLQR